MGEYLIISAAETTTSRSKSTSSAAASGLTISCGDQLLAQFRSGLMIVRRLSTYSVLIRSSSYEIVQCIYWNKRETILISPWNAHPIPKVSSLVWPVANRGEDLHKELGPQRLNHIQILIHPQEWQQIEFAMNLMFRKNFREGGKSGGGGCGGGGGGLKGSKSFSSGRNANKQRARDMSLSLQDDVPNYRTHLFFSPSNRPCYADNEGEFRLRCIFAFYPPTPTPISAPRPFPTTYSSICLTVRTT